MEPGKFHMSPCGTRPPSCSGVRRGGSMRLNCFPIFRGTGFSLCSISIALIMLRQRLRGTQVELKCALDEAVGIQSCNLAERVVLASEQERAVEAGPHDRR